MTLTREKIRKIVVLRGLGYHQDEIAQRLNISKRTVSNRLQALKRQAKIEIENGTFDEFFLDIVFDASIFKHLSKPIAKETKENR